MVTKAECNEAEVDISADTKTTLLSTTIPAGQGGRIKQIIVNGGPVATTVASCTGYIDVTLGSHAGPYRFPVGAGNVDGDLGISPQFRDVIECDIEVDANESVLIEATMNGAIAGMHAGIVWVMG